jgi:hypothetical protein
VTGEPRHMIHFCAQFVGGLPMRPFMGIPRFRRALWEYAVHEDDGHVSAFAGTRQEVGAAAGHLPAEPILPISRAAIATLEAVTTWQQGHITS